MTENLPTQEVVVYTLNEPDQELASIVDEVNRNLHTHPGFLSRVVHQSLKNPAVWMDLLTWENPKAAARGRRAYGKDPLNRLFTQRIETLELRKQFTPYRKCGKLPNFPLETVVELAVYRILPQKRAEFEVIFDKMSDFLKSYPAYLSRHCGKASLEAHWFMDYFYWKKDYTVSFGDLKQAEEVQAFLSLIYDVPYIDQFRIVPETRSHSLGSFI